MGKAENLRAFYFHRCDIVACKMLIHRSLLLTVSHPKDYGFNPEIFRAQMDCGLLKLYPEHMVHWRLLSDLFSHPLSAREPSHVDGIWGNGLLVTHWGWGTVYGKVSSSVEFLHVLSGWEIEDPQ